jgi:hypothetical protein
LIFDVAIYPALSADLRPRTIYEIGSARSAGIADADIQRPEVCLGWI